MSDDSSDDDDWLLNAGLSRRATRTVEKKRNAALDFLKDAVEVDAKKRQEMSKRAQVEHDDSAIIIEQAEEKMALSEKRKLEERAEKERLNSDELELRTSRQTAIETGQSDMLGARSMKRVKRSCTNEAFADLQTVLDQLDNKKMKRYLQSKLDADILSLVLEQKTLARRKEFAVLPALLRTWLWRCAVDVESDYQEGAYETLKEYYSRGSDKKVRGEAFSLTGDMIGQWKDWFQAEIGAEERDRSDMLMDVRYYLDLWGALLENYPMPNDLDTDVISDILVEIARVVLDHRFHEPKSMLGAAWSRAVSRLLDMVRIHLNNDKWTIWTESTCTRILDMKIDPADGDAEDSDDSKCMFSKNLLVSAFLLVSKEFGMRLGLLNLQRCVEVENWDDEISNLLKEEQEELVNDALKFPAVWKVAACISCTYTIAKRNGLSMKASQFLAIVKLTSKLITTSIPVLLNDEDGAAKWWALTEGQVQDLAKVAMRFANQAHFRRSEKELSHLKTFIQENRVVPPESIKPIQSSMDSYLAPKAAE